MHGIEDFPRCHNPACGNKVNKPSGFLGEKKGFRPYCCINCGATAADVIRHRQENCMAKYGVTNKAKLDEVKAKIRETTLKNGSFEKAVEKSRITRYQKNGGRWHAADFGDKVKAGKVKHGHSAGWNNLEKRKSTLIRKYGITNTFNLPQVRKASRDAILKKSYEDHILNCEFDEPLFTFEEYSSRVNDSHFFKFKCRKCGNTFESPHHDGYHRKCPICYPKLEGVSTEEIELRETVRSLVPDEKMIVGSRLVIPPRELDIYLPSKKLAIEFDGLFWHSDVNDIITKAYHVGKTEACDEKGIRLIHVFEDEWIEKRRIVESRLKNLLGIYDKTVFARKCEVRDVTSREAELFQNSSHIQGSVRAKVRLGLYFEDELVALMTFGKSRFSKTYEWEMLRFCCKLGYHIPGAAGKLLRHFERTYKPKSLVSYADRRWSTGNLYKALGFRFVRNSSPNYWYVNNTIKRYSRMEFQKHKLKNKLKIYDESKTEVENMKANGYFRIFDCGNMVFMKEYGDEGVQGS